MTPEERRICWRGRSAEPSNWHAWVVGPGGEVAQLVGNHSRLESGRSAWAATASEQALGWPAGTTRLLRAAFDAGLSRATGWDISQAGEARAALAEAARWFRRGVAIRPEVLSTKPSGMQGTYPLRLHPFGADDWLVDHLKAWRAQGRLIFCDARVAERWPTLAKTEFIAVAADETRKSLDQLAALAGKLPGARSWVAIGGGLTTDLVGMLAALQGAEVTFVPTTLLAMADACVGGKTGINFPPYGKNQLGAFLFPQAVEVWPGWLATLPREEFVSGAVESLKHALLLGDRRLAATIAMTAENDDRLGCAGWLMPVMAAKAAIVEKDPFEHGERAILNLGHTFGHALEGALTARRTGLPHGIAVAAGLVFTCLLSEAVSGLEPAVTADVAQLVERCGAVGYVKQRLTQVPLALEDLLPLIRQDKKASEGVTRWVLLTGRGAVHRSHSGEVLTPVDSEAVTQAWHRFRQYMGVPADA